MRILHLSNLYAPVIGGLERSIATSSEELVRRGHEVTVLTLATPLAGHDETIRGVRVKRVRSVANSLLPGMNTIVYVPSGKSYEGVFLEDTAIVQWQGRSWVYLRVAPDTFKRHPINTDQPVSDDDYVVQDIPPGSEIVVRGAQVLLSEEAKSELRGSGDND